MNDQTSTPEPIDLGRVETMLVDVLSTLGADMAVLVPDGNNVDGQVLAIAHMAGAAVGILTLLHTNLIPQANKDTLPHMPQTWARGFHDGPESVARQGINSITEAGLYGRLGGVARDYFGHIAETPRAQPLCSLYDAAIYAGIADAIEASPVDDVAEHHLHGGVTAAQAHHRAKSSALAALVGLNMLDEPE